MDLLINFFFFFFFGGGGGGSGWVLPSALKGTQLSNGHHGKTLQWFSASWTALGVNCISPNLSLDLDG